MFSFQLFQGIFNFFLVTYLIINIKQQVVLITFEVLITEMINYRPEAVGKTQRTSSL